MPQAALDVLVLSDFQGHDANVVRDFLYSFNKHSKNRFFYLHNWSRDDFKRVSKLDFNGFDVIVLFWDFFWIGANDPFSYCYVPDWVSERIAGSTALKVQFLQDEYRDVRLMNQSMNRFGVNVMFSCVAPRDQELFYPKKLIPTLQATYPVFTGYVPTYLEHIHHPASIDRPIDIGYRSRRLPYYLGMLGQEKVIIADRFEQIAAEHRFKANISVREEDRIYGDDWLTFMKACRFSLGTESGASVVDFTGQIKRSCQAYLRRHPKATFEEVRERFFADLDGKTEVRTISPRIFEAAAFENTLVLHEGHYEGILEPDVHYISVKPDYSNVDEVVARMRDRGFCEELARKTKERLIDSREFNYASFVQHFDAVLSEQRPEPTRCKSYSRTVFYFANYLSADCLMPVADRVVRAPHPVDLIRQYDRNAPYYIVFLYSFWLVLGFLAKPVRLRRAILAAAGRLLLTQPRALGGLFRDLRILALLSLARQKREPHRQGDFATRLSFAGADGAVMVESVPIGKPNETEPLPPCDPAQDAAALAQLSKNAGRIRLTWKHEAVSNSLNLPLKNSNCCVYMNPESTWRFLVFNELPFDSAEQQLDVVTESLFGNPGQPSTLGRLVSAGAMLWMLLRLCAIDKPLAFVRKWLRKHTAGTATTVNPTS